MEIRPLEQFTIERLIPIHIGRLDVSYTNSALLMTIAVVLITALMLLAPRSRALVPGRWQSVAEMLYEFVADMVDTNAGHGARDFFPFIFTLFLFILFANLLGLIPYSFTITSHIIITFALAAIVFIGVTIIGIVRHGFHFLRLFVPEGVPLPLLVILVPIELLSYFIRPFTLSIRLFANMLAGHTMLAIFGGFAAAVGLLAFFPLAINIALVGLELLVAVLQAYVFAILSCLYLNDALHLH
ncbi:MAG: F0F1 ATP synthase subunit A [Alphaproteobacteria bacterium]|nr:F0F1 ATP synthase subunit A [Alphaproteobacteria bacterium]MBV9014155.1 F0F1 ATP synthase subunit A [Alphaproteobacteria bacterium]MBV9584902.1 F0F1 ATP synthase subunit A [Alphaproteobacteria bacterium]MBV9966782.1 F0F1 ATP synthase subunit A [Alphaproteobacteria bacterium]